MTYNYQTKSNKTIEAAEETSRQGRGCAPAAPLAGEDDGDPADVEDGDDAKAPPAASAAPAAEENTAAPRGPRWAKQKAVSAAATKWAAEMLEIHAEMEAARKHQTSVSEKL